MELIRIYNEEEKAYVFGRELYNFLGIKTSYPNWIKRMIEYGFSENEDFITFLEESTGGRPSEDHKLTIEMAKEISMIQRNEKGKQARQYFIACEKKLVEIKNKLPQLSEMEMIAKIATSQSKTIERIDSLELKFDTVLTLESHKQRNIQKAISKRVYVRCEFSDYLEKAKCQNTIYYEAKKRPRNIRKLFSNIHRELKNKFGVTSYKDIKVMQYEDALVWIENWIEDAGVLD